MIEIQFNKTDFVGLLHKLSVALKTPIKQNAISIPDFLGNGWAWAEKLANGMTVMVSDTLLNQDITYSSCANLEQYFCLQFNEVITPKPEVLPSKFNKNSKQVIMLPSYVLLSHTLTSSNLILPAGVRLKSLKFLFTKDQLLQVLDTNAVDKIVNQYFAPTIIKETPEIIDIDYRPILDELLEESLNQPLRINFIQNRVMLLLEKYIQKQMQRKSEIVAKTKLNESEVERLMQAEALLVKDFTNTPPTISMLSRICAMSATKLKSDFKTLYGIPIYEYFQKNRLTRAKSILLEGNYNIKEVGMMVGYSNLSHFAAAFKREFGVLPSEMIARDGVLMYAM